MITNILRFRFKDEVSESEKKKALAVIERTASAESVAFYSLGKYLGDEDYTHAYCVGIPNLDALNRYLSEPAHREGDFYFIPLLDKLSRMMVSDDPDPDLVTKINASWNNAVDPEWRALFDRLWNTN
jgi:hypothetical protein